MTRRSGPSLDTFREEFVLQPVVDGHDFTAQIWLFGAACREPHAAPLGPRNGGATPHFVRRPERIVHGFQLTANRARLVGPFAVRPFFACAYSRAGGND